MRPGHGKYGSTPYQAQPCLGTPKGIPSLLSCCRIRLRAYSHRPCLNACPINSKAPRPITAHTSDVTSMSKKQHHDFNAHGGSNEKSRTNASIRCSYAILPLLRLCLRACPLCWCQSSVSPSTTRTDTAQQGRSPASDDSGKHFNIHLHQRCLRLRSRQLQHVLSEQIACTLRRGGSGWLVCWLRTAGREMR